MATAAGFDGKRGFALCAGFFVARPTEAAAAWLDAWRHKGRGGRNSDQVAANKLYDEGVGIIADAVVDRCPRGAVPAVWHPYSPARVAGKGFWTSGAGSWRRLRAATGPRSPGSGARGAGGTKDATGARAAAAAALSGRERASTMGLV